MNTTTRHTEYLVTVHNCVVLEGLGAILVSRCSAQLHPDGSMTPPRAIYAFNSEVVRTDGVLENSIARAEGISYERAAAIVRTDVEAMRHQLDAEGRVSLGRIGTLVRNADDNLTVSLEPFDTDLLTPLATWLPSIAPLRHQSTEDAPEAPVRKHRTPRLRRFVRAAVAAAAVVCVALVSSTPITVKDAHYASTALPEVSGPKNAYIPAETKRILTISMPESEELTPVDTAARMAWQREMSAPAATVVEKAEIRLNENDAYCLIVASLTSEEDAQEFVRIEQRRHGLRYGITESDGRWRVYAATAPTVAGARAAADNLPAYSNAWVSRLN